MKRYNSYSLQRRLENAHEDDQRLRFQRLFQLDHPP